MRVEAYRNLHTDSLSVRRIGKGGRVFTRPQTVRILNPSFVVQPAGRERVLREQRKNVHAFVRGEFVKPWEVPATAQRKVDGDWRQARYNPYESATFVDVETGKPVLSASIAEVTTKGVFYK